MIDKELENIAGTTAPATVGSEEELGYISNLKMFYKFYKKLKKSCKANAECKALKKKAFALVV